MSETLYYPSATTLVNANTTVTANATILVDRTATGAYLTPSTSNAAPIIQWIKNTTSTYSQGTSNQPFGSNAAMSCTTITSSNPFYGFSGVTYTPNGIVVFNPGNNSWGISTYNTKTNVVTKGIVAVGNSDLWFGSVLLPDGRVAFAPATGTYIGIFNPTTNAFISYSIATSNQYRHCALTPKGNVCLVPNTGTNIGIFNPNTNTYSSILLGAAGGYTYGGLHPNGNIYLSGNAGNLGVYNESTGLFSSITTVNSSANGWVLTKDGNICLVKDPPVVYNPFTNTSVTGPSLGGGISGGCLLPDGRIFFGGPGKYRIWNQDTGLGPSLSTPTNAAGLGFIILPTGQVIPNPVDIANGLPIYTGYNRPVSKEFCLHPFFNHTL
jgi:hypothetical protein